MSHPQQVKVHQSGCHFDWLPLLSSCIQELLLFRGKQRLKTVFLIERDYFGSIDCIYYHKASARLIVMRHKPTLDEINDFTAYSLSTKILVYAQTTDKNTRVSTQRLFMMRKTFHIILTASWQIINTNAIIRNRKGTNDFGGVIILSKTI